MKPRLLDLFACEGGASVGYARAGFDVYAVDLDANRLARNPYRFNVGDAFRAIERFSRYRSDIDAMHASPPCQGYTRGNAGRETAWPKLIPAVREALEATGLPYVIENVTDAAPEMRNPVALCGCMFDLSTIDTDGVRIHLKRERMFETGGGFTLTAPRPCNHDGIEWWAGAYGGARRDKYEAKYVRKGGYVPREKDVVKALLGVEHDMTWQGLFECLPPPLYAARRRPTARPHQPGEGRMSSFRTEAEFQSAVCELARRLGCLVFHPRNVKRSEPGFPDLVIAGDAGFLFRELKTNEGRLRPEQADWIAKLTAAKADVAVWRPSDWPERVTAELRAIA